MRMDVIQPRIVNRLARLSNQGRQLSRCAGAGLAEELMERGVSNKLAFDVHSQ